MNNDTSMQQQTPVSTPTVASDQLPTEQTTINPSGHGGYRPGAGRKKGSRVLMDQRRDIVQEKLAAKLEDLVKAKLKVALGQLYHAKSTDKKGNPILVYKVKPNNMAIDWCLEFLAGKTPNKNENDNSYTEETIDALTEAMRTIAEKK